MARPSKVAPAIERLIEGNSRHDWSLEDLHAELAQGGLRVDFSSVFRAVDGLVDDGLLERVDLGDGRARYERAGENHEHIRCERCDTVAAVPGCAVADLIPAIEKGTGFAVTEHRVLFSGVCTECREEAGVS